MTNRNQISEELTCWYVQQVAAAVDAAVGKRGEWAAARAREGVARAVLTQAGARFAPRDSIGGLGHFTAFIPAGEAVELRAAFVLHTREDVLEEAGLAVTDVVDDGRPQLAANCVGILADGRAVRFSALLSVAQAIGTTPPDDDVMAEEVAMAVGRGELEWWVVQ
jgi:hypothetical protein